MLTTSTVLRHIPLECDNVPTDKLLYSGLTSDLYRTGFESNLNFFLDLPVDLLVALLPPLGM